MTPDEGLRSITIAAAPLIAERMWPLEMPDGPVFPGIVYFRVSTVPDPSHDGPGMFRIRWQLDVYGNDYDEAVAAADQAIETLDCWSGIAGPLRTIFLDGRRSDVSEGRDKQREIVDVVAQSTTI